MPNVNLSPAFKRAFKKYTAKHPHLHAEIISVIRQLEINPRETHKLKGVWSGYLACSTGYDLRIIFE